MYSSMRSLAVGDNGRTPGLDVLVRNVFPRRFIRDPFGLCEEHLVHVRRR